MSVNNDKLRQLNLSNKEWQKTFSICFVERVTSRTTSAQSCNDSGCHWFNFLISLLNILIKIPELRLIEFGSGMGNLAETLLVNLNKKVDYVGFEVDDLLLDLFASMAEVMGVRLSSCKLMQYKSV